MIDKAKQTQAYLAEQRELTETDSTAIDDSVTAIVLIDCVS